MDALLLYLRRDAKKKEEREKLLHMCVITDGYFVAYGTGIVIGRCVELVGNRNGMFAPLYHYNRSWRFVGLFSQFHIGVFDQRKVLHTFEALEKVWESEKKKYTRVYFLTQKLILQEITRRFGIVSTQSARRPICDLKRYRAQMIIFNELWKICFCINSKILCPSST